MKVKFKYNKGDIVEFKNKQRDGNHKWIVTGYLDGDTLVPAYYLLKLYSVDNYTFGNPSFSSSSSHPSSSSSFAALSNDLNEAYTTAWDINDLHDRCFGGISETLMEL